MDIKTDFPNERMTAILIRCNEFTDSFNTLRKIPKTPIERLLKNTLLIVQLCYKKNAVVYPPLLIGLEQILNVYEKNPTLLPRFYYDLHNICLSMIMIDSTPSAMVSGWISQLMEGYARFTSTLQTMEKYDPNYSTIVMYRQAINKAIHNIYILVDDPIVLLLAEGVNAESNDRLTFVSQENKKKISDFLTRELAFDPEEMIMRSPIPIILTQYFSNNANCILEHLYNSSEAKKELPAVLDYVKEYVGLFKKCIGRCLELSLQMKMNMLKANFAFDRFIRQLIPLNTLCGDIQDLNINIPSFSVTPHQGPVVVEEVTDEGISSFSPPRREEGSLALNIAIILETGLDELKIGIMKKRIGYLEKKANAMTPNEKEEYILLNDLVKTYHDEPPQPVKVVHPPTYPSIQIQDQIKYLKERLNKLSENIHLRARPEKKLVHFIRAVLSHYDSKKDERPLRELSAYISDVEKGFTSLDIVLRKFVQNEKNDEITAEANGLYDIYVRSQTEKREAPLKKHFVRQFKPHPVLVPANGYSHQQKAVSPGQQHTDEALFSHSGSPLQPAEKSISSQTPNTSSEEKKDPHTQSSFEKKCIALIDISTLVIEYESSSAIPPEKAELATKLYKTLSEWQYFEEKAADSADWDPKIYSKYHTKIHETHGILMAISRQGPDGIVSSADVLKVLNNFFTLYSDIQYEFIDKHHIKPRNLDTANLVIPNALSLNELFIQSKPEASSLIQFLATYEPKKLTRKPESPRAHRFMGRPSYFPFYDPSPHIDLITRHNGDINERIRRRIENEQTSKEGRRYVNRFHVDGFSPTLFPPLLFGDDAERDIEYADQEDTPPLEYESEGEDSNFDLDEEQKTSRKEILEASLDLLETPESKTDTITFPQ